MQCCLQAEIGAQHRRVLGSVEGGFYGALSFHEVAGINWLRVGDAAMAVDLLSGNGIFQSLSSALQAPAVINTLLQRPERAELARRFQQQRAGLLCYRAELAGADLLAVPVLLTGSRADARCGRFQPDAGTACSGDTWRLDRGSRGGDHP